MSKFIGLKKEKNHDPVTLYQRAVALRIFPPHDVAVDQAINLFHYVNSEIDGNLMHFKQAQRNKGELLDVFHGYIQRLYRSMSHFWPRDDVVQKTNLALMHAYEKCHIKHKEIITILLETVIGEEILPTEDLLLAVTNDYNDSYLSSANYFGSFDTYISPRDIINIQESLINTFEDIRELSEENVQHLAIIVYNKTLNASGKFILLQTYSNLGLKIKSAAYSTQNEMLSLIKQGIHEIENTITQTTKIYNKFEIRRSQLKSEFINHIRIWIAIFSSEGKTRVLNEIINEAIQETQDKVIVPVIATITEMCAGSEYSFLQKKMISNAISALLDKPNALYKPNVSLWICQLLSICDQSHSFPPKKLSKFLENYSKKVTHEEDETFLNSAKRQWQQEVKKRQMSEHGRFFYDSDSD